MPVDVDMFGRAGVWIGSFASTARYVNEISDQLFIERRRSIVCQRTTLVEMDEPRSTLRKRVLFHRGCSSVLVAVRLNDADDEEARSTSFEYRVALTLPRVSCSR